MISPKTISSLSTKNTERDPELGESSGLKQVPFYKTTTGIALLSLLGAGVLATCIALPLCLNNETTPVTKKDPADIFAQHLDLFDESKADAGSDAATIFAQQAQAAMDATPGATLYTQFGTTEQDAPKAASRRATRSSRNVQRKKAGRTINRWAKAMLSKPERTDEQVWLDTLQDLDYSDNHPITAEEAELSQWLATSAQLNYNYVPADFWTGVYQRHFGFVNEPSAAGENQPLIAEYALARQLARASIASNVHQEREQLAAVFGLNPEASELDARLVEAAANAQKKRAATIAANAQKESEQREQAEVEAQQVAEVLAEIYEQVVAEVENAAREAEEPTATEHPYTAEGDSADSHDPMDIFSKECCTTNEEQDAAARVIQQAWARSA